MQRVILLVVASAWILGEVRQASAGILLSAEAPGVQSSTVPGVVTETFDSFSLGFHATLVSNIGTYSSVGIVSSDIFGGAGGAGKYVSSGVQSGAVAGTLTLNSPQAYFGMWWSAADPSNVLKFFSNGNLVAVFNPTTALGALTNPLYFGNPNGGGDAGEKFAYLDFTGTNGTTFDKIEFDNSLNSGFESDNHSVFAGQVTPPGTPIGVLVPEPATLTLLATGNVAMAFLATLRLSRTSRGRRSGTAAASVGPAR